MEIYELYIDGCRIVALQIPPVMRGIPTIWNGAAYAREGEHVSPLQIDKMDLIHISPFYVSGQVFTLRND